MQVFVCKEVLLEKRRGMKLRASRSDICEMICGECQLD